MSNINNINFYTENQSFIEKDNLISSREVAQALIKAAIQFGNAAMYIHCDLFDQLNPNYFTVNFNNGVKIMSYCGIEIVSRSQHVPSKELCDDGNAFIYKTVVIDLLDEYEKKTLNIYTN
tara:strand:+ start:2135 stop:2494 length:360 start_codon:yes stop_codon:yes gene_type:complete